MTPTFNDLVREMWQAGPDNIGKFKVVLTDLSTGKSVEASFKGVAELLVVNDLRPVELDGGVCRQRVAETAVKFNAVGILTQEP